MKKQSLNARRLRIILFIVMVLVVLGAGGGFYYAQQQLSGYAQAISRLNADAQAGDKSIQTLRSLENWMKEEFETIEKTRDIVAESREYRYQDQIVKDISRIGESSGVTITGFDFLAAAPTATAQTPTTTTPAAPLTPTTSGLKSQTVGVTIKSPVDYSSLMDLIRKIERNPLKMQLASVALTKDKGGAVTSQTFSIEVYVR